jgi:peptidoglycan/xylan/chitin deacetylase (PgdA/CDA1 family)
MTINETKPGIVASSGFPPKSPAWKQWPVDWGMRAVGRLAVGLNGILGSCANGRLGILTYHRVVSHLSGFPAPLHNVEPKCFAAQLETLLNRGFRFLPLSRVLAASRRTETLPDRVVVVTFDDAYASVYTEAWPVLQRLGVPATVFVATAYLDSDEPFPFDAWGLAHQGRVPAVMYRPLRTAECQEMAESGLIEIGAHTHTHQDFRGRPDAFRHDLSQSVDIVRERFGRDEVLFAFPYGGVHSGFAGTDLRQAAKQTGVTCGLTTQATNVPTDADPFLWGRFNVFSWDTPGTLAAKLDGWYGWAHTLRQKLRSMRRAAAYRNDN